MTKCNVALFNSADPRGLKVGGIETYTRDYIQYHPGDMNLLFIGPDEVGDLVLDRINDVEFRGRRIGFLPLSRLGDSVNRYPDSISESETFRFARLIWRKRRLIRDILRRGGYTAEVRRVEYAPVLWWMGVPVFSMVHLWGDKSQPMSGVLGRHHRIRALSEYAAAALSEKFYSVNPDYTAMYARKYWPFGSKFDTLTTWANTDLFRPALFRLHGPIRLVFAGRTDAFKRLDVMMRVIARVHALGLPVEFHYVGDGDLGRYAEFAAIRDLCVLHGRRTASEVAGIVAASDIGLLTSDIEGMPRFVIECLASGRPVVALHLPQIEPIFSTGRAGALVSRGSGMVERMAGEILGLAKRLRAGRIAPEDVAANVAGFAPQVLLNKIWNEHRALAGLPRCEASPPAPEARERSVHVDISRPS